MKMMDCLAELGFTENEVIEGYSKTVAELNEACKLMADAGWIIPFELQPWEILSLVENCSSKEKMNEWVYDFYTANNNENLKNVFLSIREDNRIIQWEKLMNECIKAYSQGFICVIIPSLLTIIEGIISKWMENPKSIKVCTPVKSKMDSTKDDYGKLCWLSIHLVITRIFNSQNFDKDRPELINRHWILHGRDETKWEKIDVVRLFVTVHALLCVSE